MKSSDLLLFGVLGIGALYFGNKLKEAIPEAAASYTNQVIAQQARNAGNMAELYFNQELAKLNTAQQFLFPTSNPLIVQTVPYNKTVDTYAQNVLNQLKSLGVSF